MKFFFTLLLFTCSVFKNNFCYAQHSGRIPYGVPQVPDVAALFKATERPIGAFTGTTPIEVPLYFIDAKQFSVPISIAYNNGGIKVEEVASNVGLGWSLTGTFVVSRAVRGIADDNIGGFLHNPTKPSSFPGTKTAVDIVLKNQEDIQPDIFYYSINGRSGKFFFNELGEVNQIEQSGVSIRPIFDGVVPAMNEKIKGWLIKDEMGNSYYFGINKSRTKSFVGENFSVITGTVGNYPNYNTVHNAAWHIAEIRDLNGVLLYSYDYQLTPNVELTTRSTAVLTLQRGGPTLVQCVYPSQVDNPNIQVYNDDYVLKNICAGQDSVHFYSSQRIDCYFKKLDSVRVFSRDNTLKKRFVFRYDYFDAGQSSLPNHRTKRLKLLSVSEKSVLSNDSICTKFEYNAMQLPERFSNSIDYWGYHNGRSNSTSIPNGVYTYFGVTMNITDKADRRPSHSHCAAGTLTKINYPTGGSREFVYEGHDAKNDSLNQIWTPNPPGGTYQVLWDSIKVPEFTPAIENPPLPPAFLKQFQLTSRSEFKFSLFGAPCAGSSYKVRIYKILSGVETLVQSFLGATTGNLTLNEGVYVFKFYFDNTCHFIRILGEKGVPADEAPIPVGGLRVREIRDFDPVSNTYYTTKYRYRKFTDTAMTSGELISPVIVAAPNESNNPCSFLLLTAQSQYPLVAEGGSYVVYPQVSTIEPGNGRRDQQYSFVADQTSDIEYRAPFAPSSDFSWKRGRLIAEKKYNESGGLVAKNVNVYPTTEFYDNDTWDYEFSLWADPTIPAMVKYQHGIVASGVYNTHQSAGGTWHPCLVIHNDLMPCSFTLKQYVNSSNFYAPTMNIQTQYSSSGRVDTRIDYSYYSDLGKPILKQEKHYLSNGGIRTVNYKYAFNNLVDFAFPLIAEVKDSLKNRNVLQPLEIITKFHSGGDSSFITATKNEYAFVGHPILQITSQKKYTTLTEYTAQNFSTYDNWGNILETFKNNDVKETYLYGYKSQYPVAKIVGSNWSTVNSVVSQEQLNLVTDIANNDAAVRNLLNNLRTNPATKNSLITTYTYLPLIGITSETDAKGKTMFFEYDGMGRLELVKDDNGKILKMYCYSYLGQTQDCPVELLGNVEMQQTFRKNNCTLDSIGRDTVYLIPANSFYAATQAKADSIANQDIQQNGQLFANQYGRCEATNDATLVEFESGAGVGEYYITLEGAPLTVPALILYEEPSGMFVAPTLSLNSSKSYVVTYWTDGNALVLMDNTSQLNINTNTISTIGTWRKYESIFSGASGNLWILITNSSYLMDFRIKEQ